MTYILPVETISIVGHEAAKFTPETEAKARKIIRDILALYCPKLVGSGECPLGGIDIWAREETLAAGRKFQPHPPKENNWERGFKPRNLELAAYDLCICIAVREYPASYRGRRFPDCYHCKGRNPPHVKGGGCWTAWKCARREWYFV